MSTILMAIAAAVLGGLIFTVVGIIPGTDETATMVPLTIILILAGVPVGVHGKLVSSLPCRCPIRSLPP